MSEKILIVDDSEMNRALLSEILGEEYEILEAKNGVEALEVLRESGDEIDLMLLDIVMPEMDGFDVLAVMNKYHIIEKIPVVMISAESASSYEKRAYEMGVADFIGRPFDATVVRRRVLNTMMLYAKQKKLVNMVVEQVYEKERINRLMINILSHIVEFRNGESGLHVLHIHTMTELLLQQLVRITDRYELSQSDISLISTASALHDIGKISIASEILNKPGKLTPEELKIIKTHSAVGASMLEQLGLHETEPLMKVAYEICRWHHERYDGGGYPDGLAGEEIPISAQTVALADVYDALTSKRCYKPAFSHERAVEMIRNGDCGAFNPLLIRCLQEVDDQIREEMKLKSDNRTSIRQIKNVVNELFSEKELKESGRMIRWEENMGEQSR